MGGEVPPMGGAGKKPEIQEGEVPQQLQQQEQLPQGGIQRESEVKNAKVIVDASLKLKGGECLPLLRATTCQLLVSGWRWTTST